MPISRSSGCKGGKRIIRRLPTNNSTTQLTSIILDFLILLQIVKSVSQLFWYVAGILIVCDSGKLVMDKQEGKEVGRRLTELKGESFVLV